MRLELFLCPYDAALSLFLCHIMDNAQQKWIKLLFFFFIAPLQQPGLVVCQIVQLKCGQESSHFSQERNGRNGSHLEY